MLTVQVINPKLIEEKYRYQYAQVLYIVGAYELDEHITNVATCPCISVSTC